MASCQLPILVLPGVDCAPVLPSRPAADRMRAFLVVSSMSAWIANSLGAGRAELVLPAETDGFFFAPTALVLEVVTLDIQHEGSTLFPPRLPFSRANPDHE